MGNKLQSNGLWESIEIVSRHTISESYMRERTITLVLFDEYEDIRRTGKVTKIDQHQRMLKLQGEDDYDWIRLDYILRAEG